MLLRGSQMTERFKSNPGVLLRAIVSTPIVPVFTGYSAHALAVLRRREALIKETANPRTSELVAHKQLRGILAPVKQHGQIEGVPVGLKLNNRGEAAILGIHTKILSGIDAIMGESCYAICVAPHKYVDDFDRSKSGVIVYAGEGGQGQKVDKYHQIKDQTLTVGNASLIQSIDSQLPIRVLRGVKRKNGGIEYFYDGLYRCTGCRYEPSAEGPLVYKFTLLPIKHESIVRPVTVPPRRLVKREGSRRRLLRHISQNQKSQCYVDDRKRKGATKPFGC